MKFTDGEIVAAIKAIAAEGGPPSRAKVRKRLGGGSSARIATILKECEAGAYGPLPQTLEPPMQVLRSEPSAPAAAATHVASKAAATEAVPAAPSGLETEGSVAELKSEIRVLKILLESERAARRENEARYASTIEALQHEIQIASRGSPGGSAAAQRPSTPQAENRRKRP